jgi:competence protein ComEC
MPAAAAVLPLLRHLGLRRLDAVVISHGDGDHAGGLETVRRGVEIGTLRAGGADADRLDAEPCLAGDGWHWDGVDFEVLHPASPRLRGNEGSCVLSVRGQGGSLLLTGDIERWGESSLLALSRPLAHDFIQVPHHGSLSSSSPALVEAVRPRVALVAAAHGNRWNLPRPEVVQRWQGAGAQVLTSAETGALEIRIGADGRVELIRGWRERRRRLWHAD